MKEQFTPGPWEVIPTPETLAGGDFQARIIARKALSDASDAIVVGHYSNKNGAGNIHFRPNANLIAAAPEMYEALTALLEYVKEHDLIHAPDGLDILTGCRTALKKANPQK